MDTAIVVTLAEGSKKRRYVVAQEDEGMFEGDSAVNIVGNWRFNFGGQWLRSLGKVDEMYRTLSGNDVIKIQRIDRTKVWGR